MVPELPIGHLAWLARHPVHSELETGSYGTTSYMASIEGTKQDHAWPNYMCFLVLFPLCHLAIQVHVPAPDDEF